MRSRRRPDAFTRRAKSQGFPARSVFKLEEIDRRTRLLRAGQRVLDLGAAPGSWTLYAAGRVGAKGCVVAIDRTEIRGAMPAQVAVVTADATTLDTAALLALGISDGPPAPYDVVLSDMAPSTTGARDVDQARSFALFESALSIALAVLRPGGAFVGKIFQGPDFPLARKLVRAAFREERLIRPEGTRSESYEIFVIGLGRLEPADSPPTGEPTV
ncbi:MAG: RlmE family RNA methyltransferase [Deltaproteobacteria bacterium]|nr:RlmE family RNA methyltransferase [Deltaproteobacteria bacterium]